jgi:hypothetical protein
MPPLKAGSLPQLSPSRLEMLSPTRHLTSVGRQNATSCSKDPPIEPLQLLEVQLGAILTNVSIMGPGNTIRHRDRIYGERFARLATQELADQLKSLSGEERRAAIAAIENKIEQLKRDADEVIIFIAIVTT